MATNKNALIRYKTIDKCLRNTSRLWTIDDLIDACTDALTEYEGKDSVVSKRTVQLDIQNMRSDKIGYNAPIEVFDNKYYRYADPQYSITKTEIPYEDITRMREAVDFLKEFKDFSFFKHMSGIVHRLEDSIFLSRAKQPAIHMDKNEHLRGLEYIDPIYQAILHKQALAIVYKSFKAKQAQELELHPQFLKEYNNRWFLIAFYKSELLTLALDRMESVNILPIPYVDKNIDPNEYFKDIIGVTLSRGNPVEEVVFWIDNNNANYVITKPFHHSQEVVETREDGVVFRIRVRYNYELERLILGFGNSIVVLAPSRLRRKISSLLKKAAANYTEEKLNI
ncbi:helix-turn-helix transcriptional regulator [Capnocytophaga granulosa]